MKTSNIILSFGLLLVSIFTAVPTLSLARTLNTSVTTVPQKVTSYCRTLEGKVATLQELETEATDLYNAVSVSTTPGYDRDVCLAAVELQGNLCSARYSAESFYNIQCGGGELIFTLCLTDHSMSNCP